MTGDQDDAGDLAGDRELILQIPPTTYNWQNNASFSNQIPLLQVAVDSTSLGAFKRCPRYYFYSIICGFQRIGTSLDLVFGQFVHSILEHFHRDRAAGKDFNTALDSAVEWGLNATWAEDRPLFEDKGNQKTRLNLIRILVEYTDKYERGDDGPKTVILANGKPAVELSFLFGTGKMEAGEELLLCGHLDRIVEFAGGHYIADVKSTRQSIGPSYVQQFTPDNQFSLYPIAGQVAMKVPTRGILLDAIQVGVSFVRMVRLPISRPIAILNEWLEATTDYWWPRMVSCAQRASEAQDLSEMEKAYPQNDVACGLYGGCTFRDICGRSPSSRGAFLDAEFTVRRWDPAGKPR